jgi:sporulation protein YlmC with PRC-barrel domain
MPDNTIYAKDLVGLEVVGPHGWRLGKIENVLLDKTTWKATQVEVKLEKEVAEGLHMRHRFKSAILPIPVERITGVGNVVSINYTQEDVDNLIASQGKSAS